MAAVPGVLLDPVDHQLPDRDEVGSQDQMVITDCDLGVETLHE